VLGQAHRVLSEPPTVCTRSELTTHGITRHRVRRALGSGRWLEPVPGVLVRHSGSLTRRERHEVALAWGGPDARLSHSTALWLHRSRIEEPRAAQRVAGVRGDYEQPADGGLIEVSVPHGRHLKSSGFVVVHQTRRPLGDQVVSGLPVTGAARAAVDVSLSARRRQDVEHVVADVLQKDLTDLAELAAETRAAGRLATPWLRQTLTDAMRGMRSVGESELRRVVMAAGLPEPEWNAAISTPFGEFHLDAYWREQRVGAEADGTAFHLSARDWQDDLVRQNAVHVTGVRLMRFPVPRLRAAGQACGRELWAALGI
jgi:very-short-patch-repair endonuclease